MGEEQRLWLCCPCGTVLDYHGPMLYSVIRYTVEQWNDEHRACREAEDKPSEAVCSRCENGRGVYADMATGKPMVCPLCNGTGRAKKGGEK